MSNSPRDNKSNLSQNCFFHFYIWNLISWNHTLPILTDQDYLPQVSNSIQSYLGTLGYMFFFSGYPTKIPLKLVKQEELLADRNTLVI